MAIQEIFDAFEIQYCKLTDTQVRHCHQTAAHALHACKSSKVYQSACMHARLLSCCQFY